MLITNSKMVLTCFLLAFLFTTIQRPLPAMCQTLSSEFRDHGQWRFLRTIGISAMHMQLLRNDKVVMFDRTDFGPSNISLPGGLCRYDSSELVIQQDCTAHSVLYDIDTNGLRPLMVETDTWCSSGSVLPTGTLVQTGGFNDGQRVVRTISPCTKSTLYNVNCDWTEYPGYLSVRRWYATNQILPDGRIIIVGGRRQFSYEFYPKISSSSSSSSSSKTLWLNFLRETSDRDENNLYPFLHLLPDGNLFVFANTRSIALDYKQNRVVREFPSIPGDDPRNYPSTGSSVLLPIEDNPDDAVHVEIMICGGAPREAFESARRGRYVPAVRTCGRLKVTDQEPSWAMEEMPMPRVMGDMVLLPTGDVIVINGAGSGTAGWENARNSVTRPVIYQPRGVPGYRFFVMSPSPRPRLYHSVAILLTDGRVLVGGSNPHVFYNFTGVMYPTDLSLEAYSPPYLAPEHQSLRPTITKVSHEILGYKQSFQVTFVLPWFLGVRDGDMSVRIIAPSFTTHCFGMNQRLVVLKGIELVRVASDKYSVTAIGPSTPEIAPPGFYMLFVLQGLIPSPGVWVKIQ